MDEALDYIQDLEARLEKLESFKAPESFVRITIKFTNTNVRCHLLFSWKTKVLNTLRLHKKNSIDKEWKQITSPQTK